MVQMTQSTRQNITWAGFLITFCGSILFSTKAVIVKLAFADFKADALTLLATRMLCSLPFFILAAVLASSQSGNVRFSTRQWIQVLLFGMMGYYISSYLDFLGLQFISAGLERLILFLYPSFTVLLNRIFLRQRITTMQKWALLLSYAGLVLAYIGEMNFDSGNPDFIKGSALIFLCAITFSIYITGSGKIIPLVGANKFNAYAMLAATSGILIHYSLANGIKELDFGPSYWWYGLVLALVATVVPSFLISNGLKRIGANQVAIISSIGPVSTIIQAHYLLGEPIFPSQIIGTVLVVTGILLIGWKRSEKKPDLVKAR